MSRYRFPKWISGVGAIVTGLCVFLFLPAILGIAKGSSDEKLIEELSDRENVLVHIDAETLSRRLIVPESTSIYQSIDVKFFVTWSNVSPPNRTRESASVHGCGICRIESPIRRGRRRTMLQT